MKQAGRDSRWPDRETLYSGCLFMMAPILKCPRCNQRNLPVARFCGRCGLDLGAARKDETPDPLTIAALNAGPPLEGVEVESEGVLRGVGHPAPVKPPPQFVPFADMPDVYYCWQSAWGGEMLLGVESVSIALFNCGYPLEGFVMRVEGLDAQGRVLFNLERDVGDLPRAREVTVEVPSYELPGPASDMRLTVVSGRMATGS